MHISLSFNLVRSLVAVVGFALVMTTPAWADVFEVDRFDDPFPAQACDGGTPMDCSLREAVINANSNVGPDLIIIPAGLFSLTRSGSGEDAALTGDLDVTDAVRIEGAGEGLTIIDGGGPGGLDDRIFHITASEVEMEDLTIRGGSIYDNAGGILNLSPMLTLTRTTLTANRAKTWGGGMQDRGTCLLIDSTISDNEAPRAGGVDAAGNTTFQDSVVTGNRATGSGNLGGGGILTFFEDTTTTLIRTTVFGNTSATSGGGIQAHGPVVILDSTIESNEASAEGGGLAVESMTSATIDTSTFIGNTAGLSGGAIQVLGTLNISNSTISGNEAAIAGGIAVDGDATLVHVTVSQNIAAVASAIQNVLSSTISYERSIVDGTCNAAATVTSLGRNIESPGDSCRLDDRTDQVNVTSGALNLSPLGEHGGTTLTHLPLLGSVAIDTAGICPTPSADQRGMARPIDGDGIGGAACDVGAVEVLLGEETSEIFTDGFESGGTSAWGSTLNQPWRNE